mmetsp:Transcript_4919/g.19679  ORF Transcript_4919/g.19679 Transcript_4919/m.19679 type:complete len:238 (+) Transcript_4919:2767-3480(+)
MGADEPGVAAEFMNASSRPGEAVPELATLVAPADKPLEAMPMLTLPSPLSPSIMASPSRSKSSMMEFQIRSSRLPFPPWGSSMPLACPSSKSFAGLSAPDTNPVAVKLLLLLRGPSFLWALPVVPAEGFSKFRPVTPSGMASRSFGMSCSAHICTMMPRCSRVTRVRLSASLVPSFPPLVPSPPTSVKVLKGRLPPEEDGRMTVPKGCESATTDRIGLEMDAGRKPESVSLLAAASE